MEQLNYLTELYDHFGTHYPQTVEQIIEHEKE